MVDSLRSSCGKTGPLVVILLLLGILAWPAESDLRAQAPSGKSPATTNPQPLPAAPVQPPPAALPSLPGPQPAQNGTIFQPPPPGIPTGISPSATPPMMAPATPPMMAPSPFLALARFQFKIAANAPLKDLLPVPPKTTSLAGPVLGDDLARIPEVQFEALPAKNPGAEATKHIAHQIAKINHLNAKKTDGFLEALLNHRTDLAGLSFAMGDACRTTGEQSEQFNHAVQTVRNALQSQPMFLSGSIVARERVFTTSGLVAPTPTVSNAPQPPPVPLPPSDGTMGTMMVTEAVRNVPIPGGFWERYQSACLQEDKNLARVDRAQRDHVTVARIAALMQMLMPESPDLRLGLVKYLSGVPHVEATKALARLALFSAEEDIRRSAVEALKVRRERDYTDVLVKGLRYPWPAVARRAADAVVKLERNDLVPQLVALLDEPDPRAPAIQQVGGKQVPVVRELVRVNHHRNCLLCHAPGNTGTVAPDTLTAGVPVPGEPLAPPSQGYQTSSPDVVVRIDVTYLRQDFSVFQPVADANPWPEMQRFDFLVRARKLTDEEAASYREKLEPAEAGRLSPYHRAALAALRELTGRDTAPTAEAWRRLLKLPARQRPEDDES
jgi:hypothetical protein